MADAAIHNGADAIYLGIPDFNARGRSETLTIEQIGAIIKKARLYGVKTYLAFNILIFENELSDALSLFLEMQKYTPDAWIVQDPGLALLLKKAALEAPIHASTQMSITSAYDIRFLEPIGFKRFTLSRELSLAQIKKIRSEVKNELEVFIHGSLCIAYSGQCFTSAGFGGRSANRGECAQSCRHEYQLYSNNKFVATDGNFLVSPDDLIGINFKDSLVQAGIDALKIEGRLKSPEYVAAAVHLYKNISSTDLNSTRLTFSRGKSTGWLSGNSYSDLVKGKQNGHTGVEIGVVSGIDTNNKKSKSVTVKTSPQISLSLQPGDGVYFTDFKQNQGGSVFEIRKNKDNLQLFFANDFPVHAIKNGMKVFHSSSPVVNKQLAKSFHDKEALKKIPISMKIIAQAGEELSIEVSDKDKNKIIEKSSETVQSSINKPLQKNDIIQAIGSLTDTPFSLENISVECASDIFLQSKIIRQTRKSALEKLAQLRKHPGAPIEIDKSLSHSTVNDWILNKFPSIKNKTIHSKINFHLLARDPDHIDQIIAMGSETITSVYLDFTYGVSVEPWISKLKNHNFKVSIATPRIIKPGEERSIEKIISLAPDAILVRNNSGMNLVNTSAHPPLPLIGDFSLNSTNHISANFYIEHGIERMTASYDLYQDKGQSFDLTRLYQYIEKIDLSKIEVPVEYYLPSFYMEYCLYSRYLSNGKDFHHCGFPCKGNTLELKDRMSVYHPVLADEQCRNTMFNGERKSLLPHFKKLIDKGVRHFRVELLKKNDNLNSILTRYLNCL